MATQDRQTLKGFFKSGKYPTEEHFSMLIDSMQHRSDSIDVAQVKGLPALINAKADTSYVDSQLRRKADQSEINGYIAEYLDTEPLYIPVENVVDRELNKSQSEINQQLSQDISNVRSDTNAAVSKLRSELNTESYTETPTWNLRYKLKTWDDYSVSNYQTAYEDENVDQRNAVAVDLTKGANIILSSPKGRFILATKSGTNGIICLAMFENNGNDSPYEIYADGT